MSEGVLAMSPMNLRAIKTSTSSNPKDIREEQKKRERRKLSDWKKQPQDHTLKPRGAVNTMLYT